MSFLDFLVLENNNTDVLKQFSRKSVEKNLKNRRGEPGVDHDPRVGKNHRLGVDFGHFPSFPPEGGLSKKKLFFDKISRIRLTTRSKNIPRVKINHLLPLGGPLTHRLNLQN